ncbi:hypothetical protein DFA_03153 [Cavenderia fasciculata]|uniref:Uncharacterized protein n=1 Tax=Cavenderia fasciculata TaxID=261658 RepID=F4PGS4_CACFS|nr:uncharacterized protein DFA_03153 [Cavenderia fasciculata]EGG24908.1 hypothetical protein DFA_03153 [Cavenderia fasciculata]|eukprot:XP_004362759.1 hypothetical protein DFA_03153 [Cavenderia fasciculata]
MVQIKRWINFHDTKIYKKKIIVFEYTLEKVYFTILLTKD